LPHIIFWGKGRVRGVGERIQAPTPPPPLIPKGVLPLPPPLPLPYPSPTPHPPLWGNLEGESCLPLWILGGVRGEGRDSNYWRRGEG